MSPPSVIAAVARILILALTLPLAVSSPTAAGRRQGESEMDWRQFLTAFDMEWHRLPKKWNEAPFLGNGELGTLMVQRDARTIRFDVGSSAVHDHRPHGEDDLREKHVEVLNRGRLPVGKILLELPTDIVSGEATLALYDAEANGSVSSAAGSIEWKALVHASEPVIYLELESSGDLQDATVRFAADAPLNPRATRAKTPRQPAHPSPIPGEAEGGIRTSVQRLVTGGETGVAWKTERTGSTTRLWLSVQHTFPSTDAGERAVQAVRRASGEDHAAWIAAHRNWWHAYYPESFLSTGDGYWDSFYWVQQYKLACVTRDGGWIIDNQGPWLQPTAWNATWWNLNAQLSHVGGHQANRRGAVSALGQRLGQNRDALTLNVAEPYRHDSAGLARSVSGWDLLGHAGQPGGRRPLDPNIGRECGNLLWALHGVDMEVRYWVDERLRDEVLVPLLVRAVNYYRHFLEKGEDGHWHLPPTYSPEFRSAADCTYDLDLLRWGTGRLVELAGEMGWTVKNQPLLASWLDIHENLVPAEVDDTGRMLGRGAPLGRGHRHWSHLLAIYPLRTLTPTTAEDRDLIQRSVAHWRSFNRGIAGYAHTGSSCMASILGDGDLALAYLNNLVPYLHPNTFYSEIGLPVMETPLHGATAIQDMMLQSYGGRVYVFPAVPSAWPNTQFATMRAEGGFLIDASRKDAATEWIRVASTVGGRATLVASIEDPVFRVTGEATVEATPEGTLVLSTEPKSSVLVWSRSGKPPTFQVSDQRSEDKAHRFGLSAK